MKTFVEAVLDGEALIKDVEDWIEKWHVDNSIQLPLHEYLGISQKEYENFLSGRFSIWEIMRRYVHAANAH